jgi:capsular exopolysaccharide synthesis family protein
LAIRPGDAGALAHPSREQRTLSPDLEYGGQQSHAFDLAMILRILREWRWLIVGAVALGLAAAVIVTLLTQPLYRTWVTLEVNPPSVEILDEKARDVAAGTSTWDLIATQVGLLKSRSLAERVAQDLNLAANKEFVGEGGDSSSRMDVATSKVASGLEVTMPDQGNLIRYSYVSESPQLAAQIANAMAEAFIASGLQRRFEASTYARTFLQGQIAKARRDLERSERALAAYAQSQGIINLGEGKDGQGGTGSLQGDSLVALNGALAEATARRVQAEGAYRQAQLSAGNSETTNSTAALRQSRAAVEAEYQEKRTLMKPEHPEMLALQNRIQELDRQIARERSQVAGGQTNSLLAQYRAALSAERALQGRVAQLRGSVLDLRGRSVQYNILQRELDTNRGLYDALLQRYKEVGVAGGIGTAPISIVDRAEVPASPYKPNLIMNLLIGLLGGLVAGVAAALGLEILNDTVRTRDDVRNKLGLACLGAIPHKKGSGTLIEDLSDPASPVAEAYSAVQAALRFSTATGAPKTLLLTSSRAAEGKSSSALALAQNAGRHGLRVLLIDSDLRRPAFKVDSKTHGLSKMLTSDDALLEHVVPTSIENVTLLPAGPLPPNPADLLATNRLKQILAEAQQHFDAIIVDGPPSLGLADAPLLAATCGTVMLVVESGKTRTRAAREAIERIEGTGAHIVGATLTKSTEEASYYGYSLYQYGAIDHKRKEPIRITQQGATA